MEICYIQEEGEIFNYELFDKFTTYTVNNIQHFYGMQINFICFYLQRVKNTSNTKIIERVEIFCNKIYEKLANVKEKKRDIFKLGVNNQWREFFQPNIINVADHIFMTPYENFFNEAQFRLIDENIIEIATKIMEIKTIIRILFVYYSRYINSLMHKISMQKHLLIKYEISRYGKSQGSPLDIIIHNEFLTYLELCKKLNLWKQNIKALDADKYIKFKENLEIDEHVNIIMFKYYDIMFDFQYKFPVSVIEESKHDENLALIIYGNL